MVLTWQTHNSLINAFVKSGDLARAWQLASTMAGRGVQPTLVTYNTLLDGCARAGNLPLARQTLMDMKQAGVRPNDRTYSIMIHLCARRGHVQAAFGWLRRMEAANIRPNAVVGHRRGRSQALGNARAAAAEVSHVRSLSLSCVCLADIHDTD